MEKLNSSYGSKPIDIYNWGSIFYNGMKADSINKEFNKKQIELNKKFQKSSDDETDSNQSDNDS